MEKIIIFNIFNLTIFSIFCIFILITIDNRMLNNFISRRFRSFTTSKILKIKTTISKIKHYIKEQYEIYRIKRENSNVKVLIANSKRLREHKNEEKTYH